MRLIKLNHKLLYRYLFMMKYLGSISHEYHDNMMLSLEK